MAFSNVVKRAAIFYAWGGQFHPTFLILTIMEIKLICTATGFKVCDDTDYEVKRKLKIGQVYTCKINQLRNYNLHRKYFALINCAWGFLSESTREYFKQDVEIFRKTVEISAGHCEKVYSIALRDWVDIPKSIAFDKMSAQDFNELYERVKDVLFRVFLKNVHLDDFMRELTNF